MFSDLILEQKENNARANPFVNAARRWAAFGRTAPNRQRYWIPTCSDFLRLRLHGRPADFAMLRGDARTRSRWLLALQPVDCRA
jgi:hypothetical protein